MSKKLIVISAITYMVFSPFAYAELNTTSGSAKPRTSRDELMQKKESMKNLVMERRVDKEALQKERMEKVAAMKVEFAAKRAEFNSNLQVLKDERKKIIVEKIDKRLSTINSNWAQRMNASILRLETLLEKFSTRSAKLKSEGFNTAEVDIAITEAQSAIQTAKDTVATQEAKVYVADLSDEENLRSTMGEAMTALRKDLKTAHDVIKIAKQKVIDVARALAKLKPEDSLTPKPSESPTTTPSSTPSATTAPGI